MTDWTANRKNRTQHCGPRTISVLIRIAIAAIAVVPAVPAPTLSQTCADDNPLHAVALIGRLQSYCEDYNVPYPYAFDLYALASVAGNDAIPALRKIAAWPLDAPPGSRCQQWVAASRDMLAKLGDEGSRSLLDAQSAKPETAYNALASLSFVGDDRALLALIHYFVDRAEDAAMIQDFGDYTVDIREAYLKEIDSIRRRRLVPGLPTSDYSPRRHRAVERLSRKVRRPKTYLSCLSQCFRPVPPVFGPQSRVGLSRRNPGHRCFWTQLSSIRPSPISVADTERSYGICPVQSIRQPEELVVYSGKCSGRSGATWRPRDVRSHRIRTRWRLRL